MNFAIAFVNAYAYRASSRILWPRTFYL